MRGEGRVRALGRANGMRNRKMAGVRKYRVTLDGEERAFLKPLVYGGASKERGRRATVLLPADESDPGRPAPGDAEIAAVTGAHVNTVEKVCRRCVLEGVERAPGARNRRTGRPGSLPAKRRQGFRP